MKQFRRTLDFVQDDEFVFVPRQVEFGVGQLLPVRRVFEVEMDAWPSGGVQGNWRSGI